ncbi:MAG TPA: MarC family protein [Dyella sp.]|uniref:MarC family protein n=1 Tax=Dyella sp. TaxID=1869338 RepID=UPI002D79A08A|nr:MarC family protein [Dyella sp.]HET6552544.1 MarC family protein [Dyella sp.]
MLQEFFKTTLFILASLLPIINPPAVGFIVLSMVPHATESERAELARNITLNSVILLALSLLLGAYVLAFFGISIPVLRVAGGLIVAVAGWNLLQSDDDSSREEEAAGAGCHGLALRARAFYPLTLPLTVGPGAIAVAIALGTGSPDEGPLPVHVAGVTLALVVLSVAIYLCVRYACRVQRFLGDVGTRVVMRLFAFVIFCIGVQIFWVGARGLLDAAHLAVRAAG